MKRNSIKPTPMPSALTAALGNIKPPAPQPTVEQPPAEVITVKTLADHFSVEPIAIRKVLRALGVKPSKVPVEGGWKNQNRNQYLWTTASDPELVTVLTELQKRFAE